MPGMVMAAPRLTPHPDAGLPAALGLVGPGGLELTAEWYERKPWALTVEWRVTAPPPAGGFWEVAAVAAFDTFGRMVKVYEVERTVLCGPLPPRPLTPAQQAFRLARGIPPDDEPDKGDVFRFTLEM